MRRTGTCSNCTGVNWPSIRNGVTSENRARRELIGADVAMVTSYCPDSRLACDTVLSSPARVRCFYDLDTGVTIDRLRAGLQVDYLPEDGLGAFDLVLSYTGGEALVELKRLLGARHVAPLYGSVDPEPHRPAKTGRPVSLGSFIPWHLFSGPAGRARYSVSGARAQAAGAAVPDRRITVPRGLPMVRKHLLRSPRAPFGTPGVL